MHLDPDETKTIFYYALVPDMEGTYALKTEIGYRDNGVYNFYQSLITEIVVQTNTSAILTNIIASLNALPVSGQEMTKVNNAVSYIKSVENRVINSDMDVEKNIGDLLKAIDSVLLIVSVDVSQIRFMMDRLLMFFEGRWYF